MQGPKRRSFGVSVEPEATGGGSARETSVLSRKELARELRRAAYQRAKQARAADPRHQAMKEAAKQRRREMYQQVKERRKAREAELEAKTKASIAAEREAVQRQLAERVRGAIQSGPQKGSAAGGGIRGGRAASGGAARAMSNTADGRTPADAGVHTLARDIERALQCSDVRDLLDRLRRESPTLSLAALATHHGDTPHPHRGASASQREIAPHGGDDTAES
jgi:hypothetical protein